MGDRDYVGYDDLSGDEFVGEDAEILGAVAQRGRALAARPPQLRGTMQPPKKLRGYLGLGRVTFAAAAATTQTLIVEPQRGFRPERLIIARLDSSAAAAALAATVDSIFIGDQPQSPSVEQGAPVEMFRPDATVSGVDFDKAVPGQKIQVRLSISAAPAGADTVILSCGMYGDMLR